MSSCFAGYIVVSINRDGVKEPDDIRIFIDKTLSNMIFFTEGHVVAFAQCINVVAGGLPALKSNLAKLENEVRESDVSCRAHLALMKAAEIARQYPVF